MSGQIGRITDVIGAALILGILLRWGTPAASIIAAVGTAFQGAYHEVSLQSIRGTDQG